MKKIFSPKWISSIQPRKQRKYRYNAPLHVRQKFVSAHLSKELRKEYSKRSIGVRKDDEVAVLVGEHKGKKGKVTRVDLNKGKIYIENLKVRKVSGREVQAPVDPSNVVITKLALDDKERKKILEKTKSKTESKEEKK